MKTQMIKIVFSAIALISLTNPAQAQANGSCQGVVKEFGQVQGRRYNATTSVSGDTLIIRLSGEEDTYQASYQITNRERVPGYMAGFEFVDASFVKGSMPIGFDSMYVQMVVPYQYQMRHQGSLAFRDSQVGNTVAGAVLMKCQLN